MPNKTSKPPGSKFALADLSMDDRSQLLSRALAKKVGEYDCYLREVYEAYLVYYDYDEGACYKVTYQIADDYAVTFGTPEEVIQRTVYEPVQMAAFALPQSFVRSSSVNVYPNSLLFEIQGDEEHFPNQGMTITKADLADIARAFSGASMGLQHIDTPLGDNCGHVQSVWLDASGRRLFGDVAIPKGLDELIPPGPRRVSVEIFHDEAGKKYIPQVDLVLNPQIERAALMSLAAFAAGQRQPQESEISQTESLAAKESLVAPVRIHEGLSSGNFKNSSKENKHMPTWDEIKTYLTGAGIKMGGETPAGPVGTFSVAEFEANKAKAAAFDEHMKGRRASAKASAVIGFSAEEAARFSALIDAAPDGLLFEDLEARAAAAARAAAPETGRTRQTAPTHFGRDADLPPARKDGEPSLPVLESADALFARRAKEATGR